MIKSNNKDLFIPQMISKKTVISSKWTEVVQEDFKTNNGRTGSYIIVERKPALMILPLLIINKVIYTYLVKQYRYPIAKEVWQFPMGTLEDGSEPLEQAKKELQEETGLIADNIYFLNKYYIDPGLSRQQCYVFIAEAITEGGKQMLEESEAGMVAKRFTMDELEILITDNKLIDGWIYPAYFLLKQYINNKII